MQKNDYLRLAAWGQKWRKLSVTSGLQAITSWKRISIRVAAATILLTLVSVSYSDTWNVRPSAARYEISLLKRLMEHYQLGAALAGLGEERATHTELQTFSVYKAWALQSETTELRRLLGEWHGIDYEPRVSPQDIRAVERLAALSGDDFEIALMTELIKLDSAALRAGRQCDQRAGHTQLPPMWSRVADGLEAEIFQLRSWLCDWHERCRRR